MIGRTTRFSCVLCSLFMLCALVCAGCSDTSEPTLTTNADETASGNVWVDVGSPCESDDDCMLGFCITNANNPLLSYILSPFTEGYCSQVCDVQVGNYVCPDNSFCVAAGPIDLCVAECTSHDDCRDGYGCVDWFGDAPFCFPVTCFDDGDCAQGQRCNEGECFTIDAEPGESCATSSDCNEGGVCIEEFPDGYCTQLRCQSDAECGSGVCIDIALEPGINICAGRCEAPDNCREQYSCVFAIGGGNIVPICIPDDCSPDMPCSPGLICENKRCGNPNASIGDPCIERNSEDCYPGDLCVRDRFTVPNGYHNGYCLRLGCTTDEECGEGNLCINVDGGEVGACLKGCGEDSDCRVDDLYECRRFHSGVAANRTTCLPKFCANNADCPRGKRCEDRKVCR